MDKYTIFCTPEQTKKALELDAPINLFCKDYMAGHINYMGSPIKIGCVLIYNDLYYAPTAEQMISWLEEQGMFVEVDNHRPNRITDWRKSIYTFSLVDKFMVICPHAGYNETTHFPSRKEATLAAIDAALEYLIDIKKK